MSIAGRKQNDLLERLVNFAIDPTRGTAMGALTSVPVKEFGEWIIYVIGNSRLMLGLLEKARWHPLGFLKIPIAVGAQGQRVRLHFWPASSSIPIPEDIHDHYWDFSSRMLCGELESTCYESESQYGTLYEVWSLSDFRVNSEAGRPYEFCFTGITSLRVEYAHKLSVSSAYHMKVGMIHRIHKMNNNPAATLILQGPPVSKVTKVFYPVRSKMQLVRRSCQEVTYEQLRGALVLIKKSLEG
jgi:hypothetical protein